MRSAKRVNVSSASSRSIAERAFEEVHVDCERDNWLDADEAMAYGLVDEIIQHHGPKSED